MPYLTADDQQNVTKYEIDVDGQVTQSPARQGATPDMVHLWFDLTGVSLGSHVAKVRAGNLWGWSDWTPDFLFEKVLPGVPSGIGLVDG